MLKANPSLFECFVDIFSFAGDIIPDYEILKGVKVADKLLYCKLLKVYSLIEIRTNKDESEFFLKKTSLGSTIYNVFIEAEIESLTI